MEETLKKAIRECLVELGVVDVDPDLEHPADIQNGDYATNVAMVVGGNPGEVAKKLVAKLMEKKIEHVDHVEIAGPGFINFFLSRNFLAKKTSLIDERFGRVDHLKGKHILIEHTQPNPFKVFHIGHVMNNAIGESLQRLLTFSGARAVQATYHGDVGVHVAKALWGKLQKPEMDWGEAYTYGASHYDEHKKEIDALNRNIYEGTDKDLEALYEKGKQETLASFEEMYTRLGSVFQYHFFESDAGRIGKEIVKSHMGDVFEESQGAVVFPEEKSGLHTRVFINSQGLPTYEAKDLGLVELKQEKGSFDAFLIITANEQNEYFKVVIKAMEYVYPELSGHIHQIGHGMLSPSTGKMSSRAGNVIAAAPLLDEIREAALLKMEDKDIHVAEQVALAALKFSILKQAPGKNVVFDMEQSISFEGDSGPYLQYTFVRTQSLLEKAKTEGIRASAENIPETATHIEKILYRFPEVVERAAQEYVPQLVTHYLLELAASFNGFYGAEKIVDREDVYSPYKILLSEKVGVVLKNGLWLLGIEAPERM